MPSQLFEYSSRDPNGEDGLFLDRLEAFMEKCLADIRAFSERELRPFEETRRNVAEWHAKYLFQPSGISTPKPPLVDKREFVRSTLIDTSRILENLAEVAGVQSFFLAVDPEDASDAGFLGGSVRGREFWRSLRGGGNQGARAFKQHCHPQEQSSVASHSTSRSGSHPPLPLTSPKQDAKSVKAELYDTVRKALRSVSGVRNAEMKWTNPERLDLYGVRLVGWPHTIPPQNPSSLKLNQNKQLLSCFKEKKTKFERLGVEHKDSEQQEEEDFSWAFDPEPPMENPATTSSATLHSPKPILEYHISEPDDYDDGDSSRHRSRKRRRDESDDVT